MKTRFAYYMNIGFEKPEWVPFYKMPTNYGLSDVSAHTLSKLGKPLPPTPAYHTWRMMVEDKRRCGKCWATFKNHADSVHHFTNTNCGLSGHTVVTQ